MNDVDKPGLGRGEMVAEVLSACFRANDGEFGLAAKTSMFAGSFPLGGRLWSCAVVHAPDSVLAAEAAAALMGLCLAPPWAEVHLCLSDARLADLFLTDEPLDRFGAPEGMGRIFRRLSEERRVVLDVTGDRETPETERLAKVARSTGTRGAAMGWLELSERLDSECGQGSDWFSPPSALRVRAKPRRPRGIGGSSPIPSLPGRR